jgi:hypothetical protein
MFWSAGIAFAIALGGCNNSVMLSPNYLSVTISPRPGSVAAGASVTFSGTVSNSPSLPQWSIYDASAASNPGTLTPVSGSTDSILYTAPPSPPIYGQTSTGITQGSITLVAAVTDPQGTSIPISNDTVSFVITAPSVTVGLAPLTANVSLGGTVQFIGYAVGSLNNTLTWQLSANGVPSTSGALGTIDSAGTYVAPSNTPISGNTVTVTIISQADPAKTLAATVTLQ